jgi:hypothetical protein
MSIYGTLLDVQTVNIGSQTSADLAVGTVVVPVYDSMAFDEIGGLVRIGDTVYTYVSVDQDLSQITLATGLTRAIVTDDPVELYPTAQAKKALVDLGIDDGDFEGVWAAVPQGMVLTLPDGLRDPGSAETVLVDERASGELVLSDATAAADIDPNTILQDGSVDPNRLQVGVVTNLVQDPQFTRNYWQPPRKFSIVGPDTVYTDSNFARSVGTTELNTGVGAGNDINTWTWFLTDLVPVDAGRMVRAACQIRRDSLSPGGRGDGLLVRGRIQIWWFNDDMVTYSAPPEALGEVVLTNITQDTWTPLEVLATAPEGYGYFRVGIQEMYQVQGAIDWIKPEVQVLWSRVASADYVEGESGWSLNNTESQFSDVNVLGDLGAENLSGSKIGLAGYDLGKMVDDLPKGIVSYARAANTTDTGAIGATETILFQWQSTAAKFGRIYRLIWHGHLDDSSGTGNAFDLRVHYTIDGTLPTLSSGILDGSLTRVNTAPAGSNSFQVVTYWAPTADRDVVLFALTMQRVLGTGTGKITLTDPNRAMEIGLEDLGAHPEMDTTAGAGGSISQKSKATGTADANPRVYYTKTYQATWSRSYDESLATRAGDPPDLYQGFRSSDHGNTLSLFGFNYTQIAADLAGCSIYSTQISYRVKHTEDVGGMTLRLSSHNYSAAPATAALGSITQNVASWTAQKEGSAYVQDLTGTGIGSGFRAGTIKGLGFGPGASNASVYSGYVYGGTTDFQRPQLTIKYWK